jgi:hypothetical protein
MHTFIKKGREVFPLTINGRVSSQSYPAQIYMNDPLLAVMYVQIELGLGGKS